MIRAFELRGDQPGHWRILRSLERRIAGETEPPRPGYGPPALRYRLARAPGWQQLRVRDIDLPFLCLEDAEAAQRHLLDILQARRGIRPAAARLGRRFEAWFRTHRASLARPLVEDGLVVPSSSGRSYTPDQVSEKGSVLLALTKLGYPVPDFSVLRAEACPLPAEVRAPALEACLDNLERLTGRTLGDPDRPLLLALRSAGPRYIPGFMPTYLNLGVTDAALPGLARTLGAGTTTKIRANQLRTLHRLVFPEHRDDDLERLSSLSSPLALTRAVALLDDRIRAVAPALLTDARAQVRFCAEQAYAYFLQRCDLLLTFLRSRDHYPALIFQQMICTVGDEQAYPGVLYSRHPRTGLGQDIEAVRDIFGEEIMTGTVAAEETAFDQPQAMEERFPAVFHFLPRLAALERLQQAPVTIELAASSAHRCRFFSLLQLNTTEATGRAALVASLGLYDEGVIPARRVLDLVRPEHLHQVRSAAIDPRSFERLELFSRGVSVLPRMAVSCRIYFDPERALAAKKVGEQVCLCRAAFGPEDTIMMSELDAILSVTPAAIHVVTSCRGYGIPAFLDLERQGVHLEGEVLRNRDGQELREGDWITLSSRRGAVYRGQATLAPARFERYLAGEPLTLTEGETRLYPRLRRALQQYQELAANLQVEQLMGLEDLLRLVRSDLRDDPRRASQLVNAYYDNAPAGYLDEVLRSELGSHLEQARVYDLLTTDRKLTFHREAVARCRAQGLYGFSAGSFMLGRFLSMEHEVGFWQGLEPAQLGFLLNEWVLFRKYMNVLHQVGERRVNRARDLILVGGLAPITIRPADLRVFTSLKLAHPDLEQTRASLPSSADAQVLGVLEMLDEPWSTLYDFDKPWSLRALREACKRAGVPLPNHEER